jgi:hypothetical protein
MDRSNSIEALLSDLEAMADPSGSGPAVRLAHA